MKKYLIIISLIFTTSCVETIAVGTIATGVVIAQDKSTSDTKNDLLITAQIDQKFVAEGLKNPLNKIGVSVDKQRVLLTGIVDDENLIKKANEIPWKIDGVKEVIDEIQFKENKSTPENFINYFRDTAITAQIVSKSLANKKVSSVNFKVITINQVVYLLGTAKSQNEIKEISNIAAKTAGVNKVISHIKFARN